MALCVHLCISVYVHVRVCVCVGVYREPLSDLYFSNDLSNLGVGTTSISTQIS